MRTETKCFSTFALLCFIMKYLLCAVWNNYAVAHNCSMQTKMSVTHCFCRKIVKCELCCVIWTKCFSTDLTFIKTFYILITHYYFLISFNIDPDFASFADSIEFYCAAGDISNDNGRVSLLKAGICNCTLVKQLFYILFAFTCLSLFNHVV